MPAQFNNCTLADNYAQQGGRADSGSAYGGAINVLGLLGDNPWPSRQAQLLVSERLGGPWEGLNEGSRSRIPHAVR